MNNILDKLSNLDKPLIIGISGKKQSGKNTLCNDLFNFFNGNSEEEICKIYSFANLLKKNICIDILGLRYDQCYGTDEQKNELTNFMWEDMFIEVIDQNSIFDEHKKYYKDKKSGRMTAREVMQVVGTDIFRKCFGDKIWVRSTLDNIHRDGIKVALIDDVRFSSEVNGILKEKECIIIRLLRCKSEYDSHLSEMDLDMYEWNSIDKSRFCLVDNNNMDKIEQFNFVLDFLSKNI